MDLSEAPQPICSICKHIFLRMEQQYLMQLGKPGILGEKRRGIICFPCYQKIDETINNIKSKKGGKK